MSDNDGGSELVGGLLMLFVVVAAVMVAVMTLMTIGAAFGAGTALHNYGRAFANNVKPLRVKP